jgi:hypothetical protein
MTKLVVLAVLVLAALAAADAFRASPKARTVSDQAVDFAQPVVVHRATSGLIAVGVFMRKRVLKDGRAYLSEEDIADALPSGLGSAPFDVAYVASASDGTAALGIYGFPYGGPARSIVELWRGHTLLNAFRVPSGAFAGGMGFAKEGRLVATLSSDGLLVHLFTRAGKPAGQQPATSW